MSANVNAQKLSISRRSPIVWLAPLQAAAAFTVLAIISAGQLLRGWILAALLFLLATPLLVSLEAGLAAMILFEPFRGLIRRAQYLIVDYSQLDPIHLLTPLVTLLALAKLVQRFCLYILRATPLAAAAAPLPAAFVG